MNHYSEEGFPDMQAAMKVFDEGLKLYRNCQWAQAIDAFNEALLLNANDGPAQLYLERCAIYQKHPPLDDWGGIWTMVTK